MAFKLMKGAQKSWIRLRGFHHLVNVIKGVKFTNGKLDLNHIDTSNILYKVSDDVSLKDSFTQWVKENKKELIKTCRNISQF